MNKTMAALVVSVPLLTLGACTGGVATAAYYDGYLDDDVYTVGYYDTGPYWGNTYYTGFGGPGLGFGFGGGYGFIAGGAGFSHYGYHHGRHHGHWR